MDRISGPRTASTPRPSERLNLFHGSTASFTEIPLAIPSPVAGRVPSSRSCTMDSPTEIRAAAFASGTPVAFDTKGTVRDARGLASKTYS